MMHSAKTQEEVAWNFSALLWEGTPIGIADARREYQLFVKDGGARTFAQWVADRHYKLVFNEKEDDVEYPDKVCIEAGAALHGFGRYRVKAEGFVYQVPPGRVAEAIEKGGRYRVMK